MPNFRISLQLPPKEVSQAIEAMFKQFHAEGYACISAQAFDLGHEIGFRFERKEAP